MAYTPPRTLVPLILASALLCVPPLLATGWPGYGPLQAGLAAVALVAFAGLYASRSASWPVRAAVVVVLALAAHGIVAVPALVQGEIAGRGWEQPLGALAASLFTAIAVAVHTAADRIVPTVLTAMGALATLGLIGTGTRKGADA